MLAEKDCMTIIGHDIISKPIILHSLHSIKYAEHCYNPLLSNQIKNAKMFRACI